MNYLPILFSSVIIICLIIIIFDKHSKPMQIVNNEHFIPKISDLTEDEIEAFKEHLLSNNLNIE